MNKGPLHEFRVRQLPPLSRRLNLLVFIVVALSIGTISVVNAIEQIEASGRAKRSSMLDAANVLAFGASQAVARQDPESVMQTLRAISSMDGVLRAEVVAQSGRLMGALGDHPVLVGIPQLATDASPTLWQLLSSQTIRVAVPVIDNGAVVGRLTLLASTTDLPGQLMQGVLRSCLVALAAAASGLLLANSLQKSITAPLRDLVAAMAAPARDNRYEPVREIAADRETFLLSAAYNRMVNSIRSATDEILAREHEMIQRLARAAESRDDQTGQHVARVAGITRLIAEGLNLDDDLVDALWRASPMHDIGKVGVPDAVLFKKGPLNDDELKIMRAHAQAGHDILASSRSALVQLAAEIALTHHERWDGDGYPRRLKGDLIPLSGRITAVADVCDALMSPRPYKRAWSAEEVRAYLAENSGRQFDPRCVRVLLGRWNDLVAIYRNTGFDIAPERQPAAVPA